MIDYDACRVCSKTKGMPNFKNLTIKYLSQVHTAHNHEVDITLVFMLKLSTDFAVYYDTFHENIFTHPSKTIRHYASVQALNECLCSS